MQKVLLWKKNKPIAYDFAATIFKKVPHVVKLPVIHHKILKQCKNVLIHTAFVLRTEQKFLEFLIINVTK
jgi:hypothetical protein